MNQLTFTDLLLMASAASFIVFAGYFVLKGVI